VFPFYTNKKYRLNSQKKSLKYFLSIQLEEILLLDPNKPDEEIEEIYKKVNGVTLDEAVSEQFEMMKDELENMFEDSGFDVNLQDLDKDMTPEEMMEKLKALQEDLSQQKENNNSQKQERKKTPKQLQKEERGRRLEEARNKNISSIYRQLAKALHPDLEQDEEMK